MITEEEIANAANEKYKMPDGYDINRIEAFTEGANLALKLHKEGRLQPHPDEIKEGYEFVLLKLIQ